jgi:Asp-tRNA(Asn)/Glu-tRNA(Gln) amidotransferase A subunit family amidase
MSHDSDPVAANLTSESQGNGVEANTDSCSAEDRYFRGAKGDDARGGDAQGDERVAAGCSRRRLLRLLAAAGIGTVPFQRALAQQVADAGTVTPEMIERAEWISGLTLDAAAREETARALSGAQQAAAGLRGIPLTNDVGPALHFRVAAEAPSDAVTAQALEFAPIEMERPTGEDALAFLTVAELSSLLRTRKVSSVELTKLYLARLEKFDPVLHCVVANTAELALEQAAQADQELAAGKCRGPLHGIPWGAKDLITYPPFKTTWGAPQYQEQVLEVKATVADRLDRAGAVLVAKLSLGALAMGDEWFGGRTRNPWNPEQGSSGSSAGSAAAAAGGLVGFALGSETLGSIVSPCRRCGATGLRPTFGRVSRYGCMALAWSMDKIGPIARSVEDCGLILKAIQGPDGHDPTVESRPFDWPVPRPLSELRVGYFANDRSVDEREELRVLRDLGVQLVPIELPKDPPAELALVILNAEAAAAFDDLLRSGNTTGLNAWPAAWREAHFATAVDYIRANRVRTLLMRNMQRLFETVDLYVGGQDLVITNLTGHPTVVMPNGLRKRDGVDVPSSITFTGNLFGESILLHVADAYQRATGFHLQHPTLANA